MNAQGGGERFDINLRILEGADGTDFQLVARTEYPARYFIDDGTGRRRRTAGKRATPRRDGTRLCTGESARPAPRADHNASRCVLPRLYRSLPSSSR